ncbi:NIF3-like protein 1 [Tetranychus urticae]|uniref:NIF3-like protein 1 n=1 Tax=Tetranychus urticae TaxID=32264 RepID=T1KTG7_TETUR|nr:NIF3-like protein 1 [Tetranychus urticae]XP_015790091.1 NIF3-like protein 1 [Tetranychus urticae]
MLRSLIKLIPHKLSDSRSFGIFKDFSKKTLPLNNTFGFNSINKLPFIQYSNQKRMDVNYPSLEGVVRLLNEIAPLHLAESWDNVGLLVEPFTQISIGKIVLTIDLTEKVIEEAKTYGTELIISYHPPIFHPLKSLNHKTWKERLVLDCIQCGIAVYSPHTALDAIKDGINDWLLSPFNIKEVRPINQSSMDSRSTNHYSYRLETVLPSESDSKLLERVEKLGKVLRLPSSAVIFSEDKNLPLIINILSENSSTKASMHLSKLDIPPLPGFGVGRIAQLTFPITLQDVINRTKHLLNLNHVRLALAPKHSLDSNINSIAVCAGSGGSVLRGLSVDLLITGEMSHHEVLDALYSNGSSVILCEHTNTERGYLHVLREKLITKLQNPNVEVIVAKSDADPLNIV